MRLEGKVAVVVGAGSVGEGIGNGKAAAILYAREGAKLILVDKDLKAAEETRKIITGKQDNNNYFFTLQADVCSSEDCKSIMEYCIQKFERIDILHNNVGINIRGGIDKCTEEEWIKILNTNLTSMFLTCKYAIPFMEKNQKGSIINISSIGAIRTGKEYDIAYATSKAGIIAMTREIAIQYAIKGIRANTILPGLIDTPRIYGNDKKDYGKDVNEKKVNRVRLCPMGKQGDAWDIAHASLFLASEESKYITGTTLIVDGGLSGTFGIIN